MSFEDKGWLIGSFSPRGAGGVAARSEVLPSARPRLASRVLPGLGRVLFLVVVVAVCPAPLSSCGDLTGLPGGDDDDAGDDDSAADDDDTGPDDDDTGPDDDDDTGPDDDGPECADTPGPEAVPLDDSCRVELDLVSDPQLQILWQFSDFDPVPLSRDVMMTPLVVPLTDDDGDGGVSAGDQRAVLFSTFAGSNYSDAGVLRALRGDGSALLWSVTDPAWATQPDAALAAGDINGDGWPEIVAVHESSHLMAFDRFGVPLWMAEATVPAERGAPFLVDLHGDGAIEILYGNQIYDSGGVLLATGAHGTGSNAGRPEFPTVLAVDLDVDGDLEIVVGNAVYDEDGGTVWSNGLPDGFPAVGDFDGDGEGEIVVVASNQIRVQDGDGTVLFGPVSLPGSGSGGPPTVADFDGDGEPEVGVANIAFYTLFDTDLTVLWSNPTQDASSSITGSSAFDFDGDGASEVVYADELDVWVWDGASGDLIHQGDEHASGTHLEYPVVAQVVGQGPPQIVVGSNNLSGPGWNGITLLADSARSWVGTRAVWNQHAFMTTHVNDDLTLPAQPGVPWLSGQGFRQNEVGALPGVAVPDLELEEHGLCFDDCPDSVRLRLRAVNHGAAAPTFDVALYKLGETEPFVVQSVSGGIAAATRGPVIEFELDAADAALLLRAEIDPPGASGEGVIEECDEGNNGLLLPAAPCE